MKLKRPQLGVRCLGLISCSGKFSKFQGHRSRERRGRQPLRLLPKMTLKNANYLPHCLQMEKRALILTFSATSEEPSLRSVASTSPRQETDATSSPLQLRAKQLPSLSSLIPFQQHYRKSRPASPLSHSLYTPSNRGFSPPMLRLTCNFGTSRRVEISDVGLACDKRGILLVGSVI